MKTRDTQKAPAPREGRQRTPRAARPEPQEPAGAAAPGSPGAAPDPQGAETVTVTFRLPHAVIADSVCVVGEFNDWSTTANAMERDGDVFVTDIALAPGRSYRYRYLLDGERWENDWAADRYVPNEYGGDDSVIDLTEAGGRI